MFGPAMGGGLAAIGGYNVPVMVDGLITLFAALLVGLYLPETPAFLALKKQQAEDIPPSPGRTSARIMNTIAPGGRRSRNSNVLEDQQSHHGSSSAPETENIPAQVYILSVASFFGGICFSANVSMLAIFLSQIYQLDVLHVTYVSVGSAVVMVLTGTFVSNRVRQLLGGLTNTVCFMYLFSGCCYLFMCYCGVLHWDIGWWLLAMWVSSSCSTVARGSSTPLLMEFTKISNRGKVMSTNQLFANCGRLVGPLLYGYVAQTWGNISLVWGIAGLCSIINGVLAFFVSPPAEDEKVPGAVFVRQDGSTLYGDLWEDEVGTAAEVEAMGRFVTELLTARHYKWVSRREEVMALLEKILVEIPVTDENAYEVRICQIEVAARQMSTTATGPCCLNV